VTQRLRCCGARDRAARLVGPARARTAVAWLRIRQALSQRSLCPPTLQPCRPQDTRRCSYPAARALTSRCEQQAACQRSGSPPTAGPIGPRRSHSRSTAAPTSRQRAAAAATAPLPAASGPGAHRRTPPTHRPQVRSIASETARQAAKRHAASRDVSREEGGPAGMATDIDWYVVDTREELSAFDGVLLEAQVGFCGGGGWRGAGGPPRACQCRRALLSAAGRGAPPPLAPALRLQPAMPLQGSWQLNREGYGGTCRACLLFWGQAAAMRRPPVVVGPPPPPRRSTSCWPACATWPSNTS